MSVDDETEVVGNLKVSLEAAKTLTEIYQEFHPRPKMGNEANTDREETEVRQEKERVPTKDNQIHVMDYDYDSDF